MTTPAIIVYSLDHATAALSAADACNREVLILSAPDAATTTGVGVFRALIGLVREQFPDTPFTAALDCGDNTGHALAAIRQDVSAVVLSEVCPGRARVAEIARQHGVVLLPADVYGGSDAPSPLDLMEATAPLAACRDFLHTGETAFESAIMTEHPTSP